MLVRKLLVAAVAAAAVSVVAIGYAQPREKEDRPDDRRNRRREADAPGGAGIQADRRSMATGRLRSRSSPSTTRSVSPAGRRGLPEFGPPPRGGGFDRGRDRGDRGRGPGFRAGLMDLPSTRPRGFRAPSATARAGPWVWRSRRPRRPSLAARTAGDRSPRGEWSRKATRPSEARVIRGPLARTARGAAWRRPAAPGAWALPLDVMTTAVPGHPAAIGPSETAPPPRTRAPRKGTQRQQSRKPRPDRTAHFYEQEPSGRASRPLS